MEKNSVFVRSAALLGSLACLLLISATPASAGGVYFVKPGDSLDEISQVFGVEIQEILRINHLRTTDVAPGDRLRIPDKSSFVEAVIEIAPHRHANADRVLKAVCRDEKVYHSVVKGDTLSAIAGRYNTEIESLLHLNGLRSSARLSIGQKIIVRKSGPRSHTVRRGDTLRNLAARYQIDADEIARLNHIDGDVITAGQRLLIEPCDPSTAAGSAPPPLNAIDAVVREAVGSGAATAESAARLGQAENSQGAPTTADTFSRRVVNIARTMLNVPYRFGGSSLRGIDCSAYVQRVFDLIDVQIPRTAREQYRVGARITLDELRTGDLVFFRTYASYPSHVGIYLGDNLFIHASSMVRKVAIDKLDQPYYRKRFIGARRLVVDDGIAVASTP